MIRIVFVCTGNICRSPLAEGIARARLSATDGLVFASAGTWAVAGSGATAHAARVGSEIGADLGAHRATPLTPAVVSTADRMYGMTWSHVRAVGDMAPQSADLVALLDPGGGDIPDPYGADLDVYRTVRDLIVTAIEARAAEWRALAG